MAAKIKWQTKRLGDLAEFRNGVNYNKSSFGEGVKVVGVADFQDYTKPRYDELKQINPEGIVTARNILCDGDIIFVRSNGNPELIGRSLFIEQPPEEVTHSAFTIRLRFTSREVCPKFYAYCFRTPLIRKGLTAYGGGTNISNLNQDILNALEVPVPPLPVQRRIAGILSAYDDLIENTRQRIGILEEMARSLYREWFVLFRFPGHESVPRVDSPLGPIPKGWEVTLVKDILARRPAGTVYRDADAKLEGAVPVFDQSTNEFLGFHDNEPDHLASPTSPMAIFGDHTCKMQLLIEPFSVGPNVVPFAAGRELPTTYVFYAVNSLVQTQEYKRHWMPLNAKEIVVASRVVAQRFASLIQPMLIEQETLRKAIRNLRRTRDLLLPRLLSGELELSGLEAEAVAPSDIPAPAIPPPVSMEPEESLRAAEEPPPYAPSSPNGSVPRRTELPEEPAPFRNQDIELYETDEIMAAFRQAARAQGEMTRDQLLKKVSLLLGYQRLGPKIEEVLRGHLRAAIRRRIISANATDAWLETPAMSTYTRDELVATLTSVMRPGTSYEREDIQRAVANHLGFRRLTETVLAPIKSALNSAIRQGTLGYEGSLIWRK